MASGGCKLYLIILDLNLGFFVWDIFKPSFQNVYDNHTDVIHIKYISHLNFEEEKQCNFHILRKNILLKSSLMV